MEPDRRPAMDAGIPDRPRPADIGLVVMEPDIPPFPRDKPRLRPRLLLEGGVAPEEAREFKVGPCVLALGGEEAEEAGWLLVVALLLGLATGADDEEEVLAEFLACCCGASGCGCCWVALL